ncbi:MAG: AAA family ATPase [Sphingobacteriales bacterium JAD_PAG50586_3]|nr:MAG: AAA family ATPase [Sphingobacteriales bacterium JAD_PAG50586_3]
MAGDTGVGKSLMAIQIGKHLAGGLVFGDMENVGRPRKVLYIDFELDKEGFWARYGDTESTENFFWAGFNTYAGMPRYMESPAEWLLQNLEKHIEETGAQVLIIDQIDRLQIPIGKRTDFMFKLQAITRKHKISTLLVLGTRARNFSKGVELQHIQHSKLYVPFADSVVAIAADFNYETERYIKPLKMRNRGLHHAGEVQCYSIYQSENENESGNECFDYAQE